MKNQSLLIISGPGLADCIDFEGNKYGEISPGQIEQVCLAKGEALGLAVDFRQTDDIETLFKWIERDIGKFDGLIINPCLNSQAALMDFEAYQTTIERVAPLKKPVIEVYLGNVFLPGSRLAGPVKVPQAEAGFICGLGVHGYTLAIQAIEGRISDAQ